MSTEKKRSMTQSPLERLLERLRVTGESQSEECDAAGRLWRALRKQFGVCPEPLMVLLEEAVIWRVMMLRYERLLGEEGLILNCRKPDRSANNESVGGCTKPINEKSNGVAGPLHPAIEWMAKARERYRKVMKELQEGSTRKAGRGTGFGDEVAEILEKGKGVLENALESGPRDKRSEEAEHDGDGDTEVAIAS